MSTSAARDENRIALGGIGCGPFDMRESELVAVRRLVLEVFAPGLVR